MKAVVIDTGFHPQRPLRSINIHPLLVVRMLIILRPMRTFSFSEMLHFNLEPTPYVAKAALQ